MTQNEETIKNDGLETEMDPPEKKKGRPKKVNTEDTTESTLPEDEKQSGKFPVLRGAFYCLAGPSMIALWLMFQPPPRAVYRETSVLACW